MYFGFCFCFFDLQFDFESGCALGEGQWEEEAGWQSGIFSIIVAIIFDAKKRSSCEFAAHFCGQHQMADPNPNPNRGQTPKGTECSGMGEWESGGLGNAVEWRMQWNAVEWSTGNGEWGSGWNETIVMQMCPAITVHGRCTVEAQSKAKSPAEDKTRGMWGKSPSQRGGRGRGS